jgi:hypothetical protein
LNEHVADPLAAWKVMVEDMQDLVTDPDGQRAKLRELAMLAYQRYQVDADELSDMLEVTDAAREWGLLELEEGFRIGIFESQEFGPQTGTQYFDGKQLVRVFDSRQDAVGRRIAHVNKT